MTFHPSGSTTQQPFAHFLLRPPLTILFSVDILHLYTTTSDSVMYRYERSSPTEVNFYISSTLWRKLRYSMWHYLGCSSAQCCDGEVWPGKLKVNVTRGAWAAPARHRHSRYLALVASLVKSWVSAVRLLLITSRARTKNLSCEVEYDMGCSLYCNILSCVSGKKRDISYFFYSDCQI